MADLLKNLKTNTQFNPFHDAYDPKEVGEAILQLANSTVDEYTYNLASTACSTKIFNQFYRDIYTFLKGSFDQANLTYDQMVFGLIASQNRACIISNQKGLDTFLKTDEVHFIDRFKQKVDSFDSGIGRIDASGALETDIDGLHVVLNYLKYFKDSIPSPKNSVSKLHSIDMLIRQGITGSFYYILKASYEDAIWKDGYILMENSKTIRIRYNNPSLIKLYRIGYFRFERNAYSLFIVAKNMMDEGILDKIEQPDSAIRPNTRIHSLRFSNGYLKFKVVSGKDYKERTTKLAIESGLVAYYSYIQNVPLPSLPGFDLEKLLSVYNILIQLFIKAAHQKIENTTAKKFTDLLRYPFRIKCEDLKHYLAKRTTLSETEIEIFLNLLTSGSKINFWIKPFLKIDKDYCFALLPLIQPNLLRHVDEWLEAGGFSIDERGKYFEQHIKETIRAYLNKKGYQFEIPEKSKFEVSSTLREEVDLIIVLKHIIIVCEVKCIKYPFETREIANASQRLKGGCQQALRKMEFIKTNAKQFQSDFGEVGSKTFVPLVVTNYPLFTGQKFGNVSIVDFFLLESYFSSGTLSTGKLTTHNGKTVDHEIIESVAFYSNEDEFSHHFEEKMKNPPAVQEIDPLLEIKERKISLDFFNYEFFAENAEFKE